MDPAIKQYFEPALKELLESTEAQELLKKDPEAFAQKYHLTDEHIRTLQLIPEHNFEKLDPALKLFQDCVRR